jgi:hypothetical protein
MSVKFLLSLIPIIPSRIGFGGDKYARIKASTHSKKRPEDV